MAGKKTFQGSRDPGLYTQAAEVIDHWFPVMGNGDMAFLPADWDQGQVQSGRSICQHMVDWDGTLWKFSVKIVGNTRTTATVYTICLVEFDQETPEAFHVVTPTTMTITVPAGTDGDFVCDADPAEFTTGDGIVGHALSDASGGDGNPGLLQTAVEMTPVSGRHTCFRADGGAGGFPA